MLSKVAIAVLVMANLQPSEATLWGLFGIGGGGERRTGDSISGVASSNSRGYGGSIGSTSKGSVSVAPGPNLSQYINDQPQRKTSRTQWNDRDFRNDNTNQNTNNLRNGRQGFGVFSLQQNGVQDPFCDRSKRSQIISLVSSNDQTGNVLDTRRTQILTVNNNDANINLGSGVLDPRRPLNLGTTQSNDNAISGILDLRKSQKINVINNNGGVKNTQNSITTSTSSVNLPQISISEGSKTQNINNPVNVITRQNVQKTMTNVNILNQPIDNTSNGVQIEKTIDQSMLTDGQQQPITFQNISPITSIANTNDISVTSSSDTQTQSAQPVQTQPQPQSQDGVDATLITSLESNQGLSLGVNDASISNAGSTMVSSSSTTTTTVNSNIDVVQDATRLVGNNQVIGDKNKLKGSNNLIVGNQNALGGINNAIKGDLNKMLGSNNGVIGTANAIKGNYNGVVGSVNAVDGNANGVFGNKNTVQGSANGIWGKSNLVIGNGNSVKT